MDEKELDIRFDYHQPNTDEKINNHEAIRYHCKKLATTVVNLTPVSREQSLALTKLEEVMMWANAAIARRE